MTVRIELKLSPYINPETNDLQLYRYVIQDKFTNQTLYDENAQEILKFYTKDEAKQYLSEQAYILSDFKIRKVGANTIADLTLDEQYRRKSNK